MAICVSQAVITSPTDNVTGESERSVQSMTTETELLPECGRLVFRGVELAYLNINGKQMLPLAEMLALVFRSTPRTTLFTRMEKINAERHFCQPLEIKLLKTVNGIHGSSANCTLIPKEDVERYCSIYMDREVEGLAPCRGPRKEKKDPRTDDCTEIKAVKTKNNAKLDKVAEVATHENKSSDFIINLANVGVREINTTLTSAYTRTETINDAEEGMKNSADKDEYTRFSTSPLSQDQEHASNSTQTISMLSWSTKKQANNVNVVEENKNAKFDRTKKRKRVFAAVDQESRNFNSPSKEHRKLSKKGGIVGESDSTGKSPKRRKRRNRALTLNLDLSDDSGFTSLTFEECISPTKLEKCGTQAKLKCDVSSPHRAKKQKKDKTSSSALGLKDELNLSPPPLVIKKLQNTWQVETKLESVKKELYKPKKRKMTAKKTPKGKLANGLLATYSSANEQPSKKKKQQRKRQSISAQSSEQIVAVGGTDGCTKKKRRRRRNVAEASTNVAVNGVTPGFEFFATPENKKKVVKKGAKKSKIEGKLDSLASTSSHGDETVIRLQQTPQSKPLKHAAPSGTKLTPAKSPVLKATPNFSLLNLFPSTSGLVVHDGDLCPEFTMACDPNVTKPDPSHPVWKWRLGGPVIAKTHRVSFRIRKIKQPNLKTKLSTSGVPPKAKITNASTSPRTPAASL